MGSWISFLSPKTNKMPESAILRQKLEDRYKDRDAFLAAARIRCSDLGISNIQLADRLGVHPAQVGRWWSGATKPPLETILYLDSVLADPSGSDWWP